MVTRHLALVGLLLLVPGLSCGGELEAPQPGPQAVALEESLEPAMDSVATGHAEEPRSDGLATITDDTFDASLRGDSVWLTTAQLEEHWNVDEERWVAEPIAPFDEDEEERVRTERNTRLEPLGVHLVGEAVHEVGLPTGESILVGEVSGSGHDFQLAAIVTDARGRQRLDVLPRAREPYATFHLQIVARAANDVWIFASETSAEQVDASEVYCPISIRHMQDRGYVVHFDGSRWRELEWPAPGEPLAEVVTNGDGSIDVVTGSAADEAMFRGGMPAPQRTFRFS